MQKNLVSSKIVRIFVLTIKNKNIMKAQATQSQIEKAQRIAKTSPLSFEKVLDIVIKQDLKNAPKQLTKKDIEKIESRKRVESGEISSNMTTYELNIMHAKNNLPSSMRNN